MKEMIFGGLAVAIVALLAVIVYQNQHRYHRPQLTTRYQAVTLVNGDVVYGRMAHLGSDHPVLRDAFSVRTEIDAQTRQSRRVLVRRKDDLNGADHVIFPATAIAFIEPVQPDSTVGRLIEQAGPGQ